MQERKRIAVTALLPPELIFACDAIPVDLNNFVPFSGATPASKLCAWTATWRDHILSGEAEYDAIAIVAGGDCHNALVDGEKVAMSGVPAHYFFYPFHGERERIREELEGLSGFLGGMENSAGANETMARIARLKEKGRSIDDLRMKGRIPPEDAFKLLISFSDLRSDPGQFERDVENAISNAGMCNPAAVDEEPLSSGRTGGVAQRIGDTPAAKEPVETMGRHPVENLRVALIGVPPIYSDFHETCSSLGLQIVFDELPYEFIRLTGRNMDELAENYRKYTFARSINYRLEFLENELRRRGVDGIVHYTQFACHHALEDDIFRDHFDLPMVTIQGDLPGRTPQQAVLRLEAFGERLRV